MDREAVAAVALLNDPTRAALFEVVNRAAEPVTRDEAARAVGISRKLAAFHLDRLATSGLLVSEAARPQRVGRAPKVYRPSGHDVRVTVPPRDARTLAELLLAAVATQSAEKGGSSARALRDVAEAHGETLGRAEAVRRRAGRLGPERSMHTAADVLAQHGYEPALEDDAVRLRNCPFHPMARQYPELVCGMNEALVTGVLHGLGARGIHAVLAPESGACCVRIARAAPAQ
jgi:predicted ArsR family transcriptional regulator